MPISSFPKGTSIAFLHPPQTVAPRESTPSNSREVPNFRPRRFAQMSTSQHTAYKFELFLCAGNLLEQGLVSGFCLVSSQGSLVSSGGELRNIGQVGHLCIFCGLGLLHRLKKSPNFEEWRNTEQLEPSLRASWAKAEGPNADHFRLLNCELNVSSFQAETAQFVAAFRYTSSASEAQIYNKGFTFTCGGETRRFKVFQKTLSRWAWWWWQVMSFPSHEQERIHLTVFFLTHVILRKNQVGILFMGCFLFCSIYASAETDEEHLIVCRVAYGVFVCVHRQPAASTKVIDLVEKFCEALRT